jgi:hypothetical protein
LVSLVFGGLSLGGLRRWCGMPSHPCWSSVELRASRPSTMQDSRGALSLVICLVPPRTPSLSRQAARLLPRPTRRLRPRSA